jgi:hypothetical protein
MEILEGQINEGIPNREALIEEIYKSCSSIPSHGRAFFCREGLIEFLETGRIDSFPYEIYQQPNMEIRCQVMERAIALTEQGELYGQGRAVPKYERAVFGTY